MKRVRPGSTASKEIRSTLQGAKLEVRESTDGTKRLVGYAVVFNSTTDLGDFAERVAPGAFSRTVSEDDQVMLRDHKPELLLARKSAGTLRLREDATGLAFEVKLPNTALGQDTFENVRLGNLKGCSFGFYVREQSWTQDANGNVLRTILDAQCFEVTLTAFPAYEATSVDIRSVREALRMRSEDHVVLRSEDDEGDNPDCSPDSPDYDPANDDCTPVEDRCACTCEQCRRGQCDECTSMTCASVSCSLCPVQEREANIALLLRLLRK